MSRCLWFLLLVAPAWACECAGSPTAVSAYQDSPLIFIGRVEQARMLEGDATQIVVVRVEEAFKGVKAGEAVTLHQRSSCALHYKDNQRALFYLHPAEEKGAWVAYDCHRSRGLEAAADDLLFLRDLPRSLGQSRLSGEVALYEDSPEAGFRRKRPLPGIRVRIEGKERSTEAVTNSDGVYQVYGLPWGSYRVSVDPPPNLVLRFPLFEGGVARKGEIYLAGSAGVGFVFVADNRLTGRVFGPDGKPMKGVCVRLEPAIETLKPRPGPFGCSKEDGVFLIQQAPVGDYLLVVNRSGRQTLYYPGVEDRAKAKVLKIGEGAHLEELDIHVPMSAR